MTTDDKAQALTIITESTDIAVQFNVPVNGHMSNVYEILIMRSNATVINKLIKAGFSLHMTEKGLSVNKY